MNSLALIWFYKTFCCLDYRRKYFEKKQIRMKIQSHFQLNDNSLFKYISLKKNLKRIEIYQRITLSLPFLHSIFLQIGISSKKRVKFKKLPSWRKSQIWHRTCEWNCQEQDSHRRRQSRCHGSTMKRWEQNLGFMGLIDIYLIPDVRKDFVPVGASGFGPWL